MLFETPAGLQAVEIKSGATFAADWPVSVLKWKILPTARRLTRGSFWRRRRSLAPRLSGAGMEGFRPGPADGLIGGDKRRQQRIVRYLEGAV